MAFLDWNDSLSVNFRLLDTDHKRLIELINRLSEDTQNGNASAAIATLTQLVDFTRTHFVHEETLMRKTAYPQIIPHKIEHDRLMKKIEDFRKRFAAGQVTLSQEAIVFFRTWLCDHIVKVDIHLGEWLNKHASLVTNS